MSDYWLHPSNLVRLTLSLTLAATASAQVLRMEAVPSPTAGDTSQGNLSLNGKGDPILSWIETSKDGADSLRYAVRQGGRWSPARTIAAGRHFFHHPAELPEVIGLPDGTLLAHWIENPEEEGSEAEFIFVSASKDGVKWTTPKMANRDKSEVEHGLASMVASGDHEASLVWLEALGGEDKPVFLMRSIIDANGTAIKEEKLDPDVCSCCPTAVVRTTQGLLAAYRDHTPQDIRDINTIRFEGGKWLPAKNLAPDNWKINACPINAATAGAKGNRVAIAWYTASGGKARVEFASSQDGGATFTKALILNTASAYGYTSTVVNDDGSATVSWLERGTTDARALVRQISAAGVAGPVLEVAKGPRANLGYPRLAQTANETMITWGGAYSKLQVARLRK